MRTIHRAHRDLLKEVIIFDLYTDKELGPSIHRIAFSLYFGADRNLQDHEVDRAIKSILKALERRHGAQLTASTYRGRGRS